MKIFISHILQVLSRAAIVISLYVQPFLKYSTLPLPHFIVLSVCDLTLIRTLSDRRYVNVTFISALSLRRCYGVRGIRFHLDRGAQVFRFINDASETAERVIFVSCRRNCRKRVQPWSIFIIHSYTYTFHNTFPVLQTDNTPKLRESRVRANFSNSFNTQRIFSTV